MSFLLRIVLAIGLGRIIAKRDRRPPAADTDSSATIELSSEQRVQMYSQSREKYSQAAREAYGRFHQGILATIGGIILLSFTAFKDIGHEAPNWLVASWFTLFFAGAFALAALVLSGEADRERIRQLDCIFTYNTCDETKADRLNAWSTYANVAAAALCVLGAVFFARYVLINLDHIGEKEWQQRKVAVVGQAARPQAPPSQVPPASPPRSNSSPSRPPLPPQSPPQPVGKSSSSPSTVTP